MCNKMEQTCSVFFSTRQGWSGPGADWWWGWGTFGDASLHGPGASRGTSHAVHGVPPEVSTLSPPVGPPCCSPLLVSGGVHVHHGHRPDGPLWLLLLHLLLLGFVHPPTPPSCLRTQIFVVGSLESNAILIAVTVENYYFSVSYSLIS